MGKTFAERCEIIEQCLPESPFAEMTKALHSEMLEEIDKMSSLSNLYDFGGLYVYIVYIFDEISFSKKQLMNTFNKDAAIDEVDRIKKLGGKAIFEQFLVKFDGAFAAQRS